MNLTTSQTQRALHFLVTQQAPAGHPFAGAFVSMLYTNHDKQQKDYNVFNTASTLLLLRELNTHAVFNFTIFSFHCVETMASKAVDFLQSTALQNPSGSYAFWPPSANLSAQPDLDDTALVLLGFKDLTYKITPSEKASFSELAWRLFAPYRLTSGTSLAMSSRWAEAFPGIFLTWMLRDDQSKTPAVIDAVAVANVCRLLLEMGLLDFPGLSASLSMLATVLEDSLTKETTIPIEQLSPYYRCREKLLAACAQLLA